MPYFCSFVVPTIGRETLHRSLDSIVAQTDQDWNAYVVGDGMPDNWTPLWIHPRILYANTVKKLGEINCGGLMRDHALSNVNGQWVAFVDDDDRVDPEYVKWLREDSPGHDVVIFRMKLGDGAVLPPDKSLSCGLVGISFAVRLSFQQQANVWFVSSVVEDWIFLEHCRSLGARIKVSDRIAYYVRH